MVINLAFVVDRTLLISIFAVSNDVVSVDVPIIVIKSITTRLIRTLLGLSFSGRISTTVCEYVTFFFAGIRYF